MTEREKEAVVVVERSGDADTEEEEKDEEVAGVKAGRKELGRTIRTWENEGEQEAV